MKTLYDFSCCFTASEMVEIVNAILNQNNIQSDADIEKVCSWQNFVLQGIAIKPSLAKEYTNAHGAILIKSTEDFLYCFKKAIYILAITAFSKYNDVANLA